MHPSLINPYIRVAMESKISYGHNISFRAIYDYEIIYLESGEFTLVYDNKPYHCRPGDIIFIRPGIEHSLLIDRGDISQPHIHFDITYRPQSENIPVSFKNYANMTSIERGWIHKDCFSSYPHCPFVTVNNKSNFLECFYKIVRDKEDNLLLKKALMIQLISIIVDDNFKNIMEEARDLSIERQIKDYIDARNGLGMTLDDFENTFFYNKFYLEKKFKEAFGLGIIEYRNRKKMEMANELLKIHSVSETSELLCYQSIYSFSRAYKRYFGYAPSHRENKV
jgi:AraC-like DNA-binding protein